MDCLKAQRKLSSYMDNELPAKEKGMVSAHLSKCEKCTAELALLTGNDIYLKQHESVRPSVNFRAELWESIRNTENTVTRETLWDRFMRRWIPVPVVCSALIVLFAAFTAVSPLLYAMSGNINKSKVTELANKTLPGFSGKNLLGPLNFIAFCDDCHKMLCEGCEECSGGACATECEVKK